MLTYIFLFAFVYVATMRLQHHFTTPGVPLNGFLFFSKVQKKRGRYQQLCTNKGTEVPDAGDRKQLN
jgi:hypothetical protein